MTGKPDDLFDRLRDRAYSCKPNDPLLKHAANKIRSMNLRLAHSREQKEARS